MYVKVKLKPIEIEIPDHMVPIIAREEFDVLTEEQKLFAGYTITNLIQSRISRFSQIYDVGKIAFIKDQLGLTNEK